MKALLLPIQVLFGIVIQTFTDPDAFLLLAFSVVIALLSSVLVGVAVFLGGWWASRIFSANIQYLGSRSHKK